MASENVVKFGLGNGLQAVKGHAITWSEAERNLNQNTTIFIQENAFQKCRLQDDGHFQLNKLLA